MRIDVVDGSLGDALEGVVLRDGEGLGGEVMREATRSGALPCELY
ncbi:hypothetical protein PV379_29205 [Streptomyces caniscabiei]|nr:hypothetical protein [Streptomyces caniscabiei]MDX2781350.1 hypothetical protein [Streptomyces caniscabiei]